MKTAEKMALLLVLWLGFSGIWFASSALAQSAELEEVKRLNDPVMELAGQGKVAEAVPLAQKALNLQEKALGPNHPTGEC